MLANALRIRVMSAHVYQRPFSCTASAVGSISSTWATRRSIKGTSTSIVPDVRSYGPVPDVGSVSLAH
jgi:hypothetical protein